jgi:malate dehydrogenase (oxaloacetate-decarboxylating)
MPHALPRPSNSVTLRVRLQNTPGTLARLTALIGEIGGNIGAIDIVRTDADTITRDLTVYMTGEDALQRIADAVKSVDGIELVNVSDRTFLLHLGGKLDVVSRVPVRTRDDLSMAYTPGVARVCRAIAAEPDKVYNLTIKGSTVAVVSDGTAVLGLGDIGPEAAMPVMEGKAQLFREFAGVNAFPICLATKDTEEIIETVKRLAPTFGGINLEDISAPRCFEIEARLKAELDIPVFHDDQHGTAVVTTAAFINALKLVGKRAEDLKVVVLGVGAAGTAVSKMLLGVGVRNLIGVDRSGAVCRSRPDLAPDKRAFAGITNPHDEAGSLHDVIRGADVFVGLSAPNVIDETDLDAMNPGAMIFAMSNPDPEIAPEVAGAHPHVAVVATGRSDYPNQINNVLCFPGIFKGALACRATDINEAMKQAAARAIAACVDEAALSADYIIPSVFDPNVAERVAEAVVQAAVETGVARKV